MPQAAACRWSDLPVDHPAPLIDRRRLLGEHCMISHVTLHKGFVVPMHHHPNEQFAVVVSGLMRFTLPAASGPDRILDLGPGEVLHLPPNIPHQAQALETSIVLDIFSPPSERTGVDVHAKA